MKYFVINLIILGILSTPVFAQLTQDDLNQIRLIIKAEIKAEITPIKAEIKSLRADLTTTKEELKGDISSVNENVAGLKGRTEGVEKSMTWLIVIIVALFGISQAVVVWRNKRDRTLEKQVETLMQEIETLKKQRIAAP